jgi:phage tail sheath protein FI
MPVPVSYPGVYVEEISSGIRTITGVATSITAFVGTALRGPADDPTTITSFADFERIFGGLHRDYPLGYAVRDFFLNGGSIAVIVRAYKVDTASKAKASLALGDLKLAASSQGTWGAALQARADLKAATDENAKAVAQRLGVDTTKLFDLTVRDGGTGRIETFLNLTMADTSRRVDRVLESEGTLVRWAPAGSETVPDASKMPAQSKGSPADADVWAVQSPATDNKFSGGKDGEDGKPLDAAAYSASLKTLPRVDLFNLLCLLPDARGGTVPKEVYSEAMLLCVARRAFLLVDSNPDWTDVAKAKAGVPGLGLNGDAARNAAVFFPRLKQADPMLDGQLDVFPASGMVAGVFARTDAQRGVWKAPAGTDAALNGVAGLQVPMTDVENGLLNPAGINCLRTLPVFGHVVWGARTLRGADAAADEYKYIPVRRTALFIEESLYRGLKWVVFEPNDEPLWAQVRLNVGAFMHNLFRQGAFQGRTPREAYLVKCDAETTTQNDINLGIVNIVVGFAPLKPAEFVIIKLQQLAGQVQS